MLHKKEEGMEIKKIYFIILGIILLLILGYFLGAKITALIGSVLALFGWRTRIMLEKIEQEIEKEKKISDQVKKNINDRKKRDEDLSNRLNNFFNMFLILILCSALLSWPTLADNSQPPPLDKLIIPDDYDTFVEMYKEIVIIALEYQKLYREAEADNEILLKSIENLQKLIEAQQEIIDRYLRNDLKLSAGLNIVPMNLQNSGIILSLEYEF